jgi:hypothetical protein
MEEIMKEYQKMEEKDWGNFQLMSSDALYKIATGEVNARKIAKEMLAGRGLGKKIGKTKNRWVGFENAEKEWNLK